MDQLLDITCIPIKLDFEVQPTRVEYEKVSEIELSNKIENNCRHTKQLVHNIDSVQISKGPHINPVCSAKKGFMDDVVKSLTHSNKLPHLNLEKNKTTEYLKKRLAMDESKGKSKFEQANEIRKIETKRKIIPGQIKYSVEQYPDVIIDYIGGMMYVPPSSDPDYEENS